VIGARRLGRLYRQWASECVRHGAAPPPPSIESGGGGAAAVAATADSATSQVGCLCNAGPTATGRVAVVKPPAGCVGLHPLALNRDGGGRAGGRAAGLIIIVATTSPGTVRRAAATVLFVLLE
jgi:hypothetical protein